MNRVIRACVELGERNPIVSIHDQGAGGNGNVLKEICEPLGARLQVRAINSGDSTLSVLELWGAEYQARGNANTAQHAPRSTCPRAAATFAGELRAAAARRAHRPVRGDLQSRELARRLPRPGAPPRGRAAWAGGREAGACGKLVGTK